METALGIKYQKVNSARDGITFTNHSKYSICRYADDFVIMCKTKEDVENIYALLTNYLTDRGLTLAENKTRITRISEGFDFLGFNVRKYKVSNKKGAKEGWKLLVKPSNDSVKTLRAKIRDEFAKAKGGNTQALIGRVNPIVTGTANYWLHSVAKEIFGGIDHYIHEKTRRWINRSHPHKNWKWKKIRYFKSDKAGQSKSNWIFTDPKTVNQLKKMAWTSIERHVMIKHDSSPFDSNLTEYYRLRDIKEFDCKNVAHRQKLAKKQNYVCTMCGLSIADFKEGLEKHHKIPQIRGGSDEYKNLQLVHTSCHIDYHKVFPAKGAFPTQAQLTRYRITKKKLRLAGI